MRPTAARSDRATTIEPLAAFNDNYIWLLSRGTRAAVVDPGDAAPVAAALESRGLELDGILITHHHPDHVGGLPSLVAAWPNARVIGPSGDAIPALTERVAGGDSVTLLDDRYEVIEVPGHTLDHIAYYGRELEALFCGDTLFAGGCGRLFEGTPGQMFASLARLAALPGSTRVYCAHEYTAANLRFAAAVEPASAALQRRIADTRELRAAQRPTVPSTIALERETNPFLRCDQPAIRATAAQRDPQAGDSPLATFTTLRAWKNAF